MQTFLPYPDYAESARSLDDRRLGKQRVENLQILKACLEGVGWVHHPATLMWKGYEGALLMYQNAICHEWAEVRGFEDTCRQKAIVLYFKHRDFSPRDNEKPPWFGDVDFHISHQSNLVRKDEEYYGHRFPGVRNDLPYVWPVQKEKV